MKLLAIDPGNTESAYAVIDINDCRPVRFGKVPNHQLLADIRTAANQAGLRDTDHVYIEMIASYGMAVGREVFETCVWIGRFTEAADRWSDAPAPTLVLRHPVKLHHCHSAKAKDSNVTQALVDRFAPGQPNHGKGTKANPGWFHGFKADVWQAYALAVYAADMWLREHPQTAVPAEEGEADAGTAHQTAPAAGSPCGGRSDASAPGSPAGAGAPTRAVLL